MIRRALERFTRSFLFPRRLPEEYGSSRIWVSPSAGLRYIFRSMREIDPILLSLAHEFVRKDYVVWDIGANVGLFTFSSAYLSGKNGLVVAVEPDIWLVQLLRRSSSIQSRYSAPVRIVPLAVGESASLRNLHIARRSRSANFLEGYGSTQAGGTAEVQMVLTISLDWLAETFPFPDLLKIDVEGAELEVLKGARMILREKRPVVLCEVESDKSRKVTSLLVESGYRIYDGQAPVGQRQEVQLAPYTTLAMPVESCGSPDRPLPVAVSLAVGNVRGDD